MQTIMTLEEVIGSNTRVKIGRPTRALRMGEVITEGDVNDMKWALARPLNAYGLAWRIKAALHVLKGRAVPVEWF